MGDSLKDYNPFWVMKYIPGFRTGKVWKMILAGFIYSAMMFLSIINMQDFRGTGTVPYLVALAGVIICFWVGPLVIADVGYWTKKVKLFARMQKVILVICRTWFGSLFLSFGYYLIIYAGGLAGLIDLTS